MYLFYTAGSEWKEKPPTPADWLHQLGHAEWADVARFRWGHDLAEGLHGMMEKFAGQQSQA
jgi:hypothetical protein